MISSSIRQYKDAENNCTDPVTDTQAKIRIRIHTADLDTILENAGDVAGVPGIYVGPLNEDGAANHNKYRVVWFKRSACEQVLVKARQLSVGTAQQKGVYWNAIGYWGIRLHKTQHEAGLKELKPEFRTVKYVEVQSIWKLVNLPKACDKAAMHKYIDAAGWKAVPPMPLGERAWRVSAEGPAPTDVWQIHPNDASQRTFVEPIGPPQRRNKDMLCLTKGPPSARQTRQHEAQRNPPEWRPTMHNKSNTGPRSRSGCFTTMALRAKASTYLRS